jgi:hypothetical protein
VDVHARHQRRVPEPEIQHRVPMHPGRHMMPARGQARVTPRLRNHRRPRAPPRPREKARKRELRAKVS